LVQHLCSQRGEISDERLTLEERIRAINAVAHLKKDFPKVQAPGIILDGYRHPPPSPQDCVFAQTTACFSPDLKTPITPCQIGGRPVCSECGCFASARWDLMPQGSYMWVSLQKVRGCPQNCSFCSVWRTDRRLPRHRVDKVAFGHPHAFVMALQRQICTKYNAKLKERTPLYLNGSPYP
jgi:radical SAM superfamily enzyme YgiQ (UPF0313 family)